MGSDTVAVELWCTTLLWVLKTAKLISDSYLMSSESSLTTDIGTKYLAFLHCRPLKSVLKTPGGRHVKFHEREHEDEYNTCRKFEQHAPRKMLDGETKS
jgi:hypothetical protein